MQAPLQHIAQWHTSRRAYGLRLIGVLVLTVLMLAPSLYVVGLWVWLGAGTLLALVYMFVLDDFRDWRRHARAVWTLTSTHLRYENPLEDMEPHQIPLTEITHIRVIFGHSAVLRLQDGQAITMAYIDGPKAARTAIETARTHIKGAL
mgnify:CR=1 FL=1